MDAPLRYVDMAKAVSFEVENVTEPDDITTGIGNNFTVDCQYINGFSRPVTLIDRNGMKVEIPPNHNHLIGDFIVRLTVTLGREVNVNIEQLLNSACSATRTLGDVIQKGAPTFRNGERRHQMDFRVKLQDMESRGGSLYLTNLDIVVSLLQSHMVPHHPRSEAGIRNNLVEQEDSVNDVESFGYSLRIVDSGGFFGERFVNINRQVYRVPVVRGSRLQDGVYLTSSGPVEGDYALRQPVSKRYNFEEADEALGLYRTVEEARTLGDEYAAKEKELKEMTLFVKKEEQRLKEERQRREAEFEERKRELERERFEEDNRRKEADYHFQQRQARLKEEIAELEHKRNIEMIRRKDGYEERALQRKESSEVVKYLPAIFTGLLALFVAIKKA